jgi:hypothetical protein
MTIDREVELPRRRDRVELARQARGLLQDLGNEPSEVAAALHDAGVRGLAADARQCALATYVRAVMEGDARVTGVRVFHDRLVVTTPGRWHHRRVAVALPIALRAFVAGFDAQRYPALLRRPDEVGAARPERAVAAEPQG